MKRVSDPAKAFLCSILVGCCPVVLGACAQDDRVAEPRTKEQTLPSHPSPIDEADDVAVNVSLTWEFPERERERNGITFAVYFGRETNPPKLDSTVTELTYDPGPLLYGAEYYWKIVAVSSHQVTTEGPEWQFATRSNKAPSVPIALTPPDQAQDQSASIVLTWEPSTDPEGEVVTYDIFFGTESSPPPARANQTQTSFDPGGLEADTRYFWKLVARDEWGNRSTGGVWEFRTMSARWQQMDSGTTVSIRDIWGESEDYVIAVGGEPGLGKVLRWNGEAWEVIHTTDMLLRGVGGVSSTNIWIVGDEGTLIHYDGAGFSPPVFPSPTLDHVCSVRGWPGEPGNFLAVGYAGRVLRYDVNTGVWRRMVVTTSAALLDIWGSGSGPEFGDVYAVGSRLDSRSGGIVIHYRDGGSWTAVQSPTTIELYSVWSSAGHLYVAGIEETTEGERGVVLHYDREDWLVEPVSDNANFAVWGTSTENVFVKPQSSTLYHSDGLGWSEVPGAVFEDATYWDIWGFSETDIFIVGDDGLIYRYSAH
jgi:hypothetical protein